ncbi:MAG: MgtC/SapB family protein [Erythrobacter sp.]|nr:MgtC/SapB family protein [Erythrobacter sp.]
MTWQDQLLHLGAALAIGLMIGLERGWNLREARDGQRVAGIRTITLLAMVAGVAGVLTTIGHAAVGAVITAGAAMVVVLGYARALQRRAELDATSAVAAMVALALGYLAGVGQASVAVACGAVATLLLAMRQEVHGWVDKLDKADIKAFARYAVIALAVYPFLPDGQYGPYGAWEPRTLWLVVIVVTGFSFGGYIANRRFGARRGTIATAIIGGAYSSTAVTQSLS